MIPSLPPEESHKGTDTLQEIGGTVWGLLLQRRQEIGGTLWGLLLW